MSDRLHEGKPSMKLVLFFTVHESRCSLKFLQKIICNHMLISKLKILKFGRFFWCLSCLIKAGAPNLALTMHPISISTVERVPPKFVMTKRLSELTKNY